MTFNDDADISSGHVSKRGRNTAIGVGGGGLGLIAVVIISQLLGVDLTGLVGGTSGTSSDTSGSPLSQCTTGSQANSDIDCRMKAASASLDTYLATDGFSAFRRGKRCRAESGPHHHGRAAAQPR